MVLREYYSVFSHPLRLYGFHGFYHRKIKSNKRSDSRRSNKILQVESDYIGKTVKYYSTKYYIKGIYPDDTASGYGIIISLVTKGKKPISRDEYDYLDFFKRATIVTA